MVERRYRCEGLAPQEARAVVFRAIGLTATRGANKLGVRVSTYKGYLESGSPKMGTLTASENRLVVGLLLRYATVRFAAEGLNAIDAIVAAEAHVVDQLQQPEWFVVPWDD